MSPYPKHCRRMGNWSCGSSMAAPPCCSSLLLSSLLTPFPYSSVGSLHRLQSFSISLLLHGSFPEAAVLDQLLQCGLSIGTVPSANTYLLLCGLFQGLQRNLSSSTCSTSSPFYCDLGVCRVVSLTPSSLLSHSLLCSIFFTLSQQHHPAVGPLEPSCVPHWAVPASPHRGHPTDASASTCSSYSGTLKTTQTSEEHDGNLHC